MIDIVSLYRDYNVHIAAPGEPHGSDGSRWVNTPCPFCIGNPGNHLGFNIQGQYYYCWRCGGHSLYHTLHTLLKLPYGAITGVLQQYSDGLAHSIKLIKEKPLKPFKMPPNLENKLPERHRRYLEKRNFNPDDIENRWGVKATTLTSRIDKLNYKWRLIIPVMWNYDTVTFLSRDITGKAKKDRYLVCPREREKVHIKRTLYGKQEAWGDLGIGVEGVTDVWRIGERHGVGMYGIEFSKQQVRLVSQLFRRFVVLFDDDPQAVEQGRLLRVQLQARGVDCIQRVIKGDPAEMKQDEADALVRDLCTFKVK